MELLSTACTPEVIAIAITFSAAILSCRLHLRRAKPQRNIDPIGEAEVFLFTRKPAKAIQVLQCAIRLDPANLAAKVTLLRAFADDGRPKDYCSLARELFPVLSQHAIWQQIKRTGRRLAPQERLFQDHATPAD